MTIEIDRRALLAALALSTAAPAWAAAKSFPLIRRGDRLFVSAVVNGVPVEALLDSAAEASIADPGFAAKLALAQGTAATARGTGAQTQQARLVPHVRIEAAGIVIPDTTVGVIDLGDVGRRLIGRRIDFIVGRDLFDAARIAIDIRGGSIGAVDRSAVPKGVRLPLRSERGNELMPIAIEGRPAMATFDLGNGSGVLVSRKFADAHLRDGRATGSTSGGGIGGAKTQETLTLKSLTVGGRTFTNVPARIDDGEDEPDANVGVGILQHFRITADFAENALWLEG